jgi:NHL repeat
MHIDWKFDACLLTSLLSLGIAHAQVTLPASGIINTVAGNGSSGDTGDGGPATSAAINPTAVAIDTAGNIYVVDFTFNSIREVNASTGVINTIAGTGQSGDSGDGGPATSATLSSPEGVALDGAGNIYIAEEGGARIRKVTASTGIIDTVAGNGACGYSGDGGPATAAQLCGPNGVAVDGAGNIFIADLSNYRIRKVTASTGIISTVAGTGTYGYSGDGGAATNAQLAGPIGVGVDEAGNLYIATYVDSRVREVNASSGIINTIAGNGTNGYSGDGGPGASAELYEPNGVGVDAAGDVYIADSLNNRIRMVAASTGIITTVAGDGPSGSFGTYSGDGGQATQAGLDGPVGVAIDPSGTVYIADDFSARVRAVGPPAGSGHVNPKFVVLAVSYAPPGSKSTVNYGGSVMLGTSSSLAGTFTNNTNVSVTIASKVGIFGTGNSLSGTASTAYTQEQDTSSSVAVNQTTSSATIIPGPAMSSEGVDHDFDIVWVWLNPKVNLTTGSTAASLFWNGYSYDDRDPVGEMDVVPVYLYYLENPSMMPPQLLQQLARSWDPSQGGLTSADYATILARDPFGANPGYNPAGDGSGRFDLESGEAFAYQPPPPGGQPLTETYTLNYQTTSTTGQGAQDTYQVGFSTDAQVSAGVFFADVSEDFKNSNTTTWINKTSTQATNTTGQTASLSITGPATTDNYTGPTQMQVWKDNVYGTFMFFPVQ